jgi:hypothetical protein
LCWCLKRFWLLGRNAKKKKKRFWSERIEVPLFTSMVPQRWTCLY